MNLAQTNPDPDQQQSGFQHRSGLATIRVGHESGLDADTTYHVTRGVSDCVLSLMPLLSHQKPGHGEYMGDFAPEMTNVWHEWHTYVNWGYEKMTEDQLINQGVTGRVSDINNWKGKPLFLAEWSFASPKNDSTTRRALGAKRGWAFWTWKKSSDTGDNIDRWSLRSALNLANSLTPTATEKATAIYDSTGKSLTLRNDPWRLVNEKTWINAVGPAREWWYDSNAKTLCSNLNGQCLDGYPTQNGQYAVHGYACAAGNPNQVWTLSNGSVVHNLSKYCLTSSLTLVACDASKANQEFTITN
ncbi:unnamed protein product [Aphanomyces euteiches]